MSEPVAAATLDHPELLATIVRKGINGEFRYFTVDHSGRPRAETRPADESLALDRGGSGVDAGPHHPRKALPGPETSLLC